MTTLRAADVAKDIELDEMLKRDSREVVALLCHDALFKDEARVSTTQRAPLISTLAFLERNPGNKWMRVQGLDRLKKRLKHEIYVLPTVREKIDAEVELRVVINELEYFVIVYNTSSQEMYGTVRVSTADLSKGLALSV